MGAVVRGLVVLLLPWPAFALDPVADYAILLATTVKEDGIDYAALAEGRAALDAYVRWLATADPGATGPDRASFWINAHNALALQQALDTGEAAREEGRSWKVAGREVTLDAIEGILAGFGDPLVHFALHRAARSSPPLSAALYEGRGLKEALAQQARAYVAQQEFQYAQLHAVLSMLFLRHREELEAGREGTVPPLQLFLADHLPKERPIGGEPRDGAIARSLRTTPWRISFRPDDGALDEAGGKPHGPHPVWLALYAIAAAALLLLGLRAFRRLLGRAPPPAPGAP